MAARNPRPRSPWDDAAVAQALRTDRRGTAAGLSGATCEHYTLLLDDAEELELFTHAANLLVAAHVSASVAAALGLSRLTALRKPGGGVRGIATGDTFRRLVSRSLARMFADTFDEATRPYQFALQTRAGTDALSGMLRAAVDLDSAATIVSLDGRSAYGTISRTAFLRKLHAVAPALIPFVRLWYGQQSTYFWWDQDGQRRTIHQGEGCEQGDALAPALYALGQHDALVAAGVSRPPAFWACSSQVAPGPGPCGHQKGAREKKNGHATHLSKLFAHRARQKGLGTNHAQHECCCGENAAEQYGQQHADNEPRFCNSLVTKTTTTIARPSCLFGSVFANLLEAIVPAAPPFCTSASLRLALFVFFSLPSNAATATGSNKDNLAAGIRRHSKASIGVPDPNHST